MMGTSILLSSVHSKLAICALAMIGMELYRLSKLIPAPVGVSSLSLKLSANDHEMY